MKNPKMQTKFVIIAYKRTGSTWLCSLLDKHPDISCKYELLHKKFYKKGPVGLDEYLNNELDRTSPVVGFKALHHHLHVWDDVFFSLYKWALTGFKVILLERNPVDVYISTCLARQSSVWNVFRDTGTINFIDGRQYASVEKCLAKYNRPITFDVEQYRKLENKLIITRSKLLEAFPNRLDVHYDELPAIGRVYDYLGVEKIYTDGASTTRLRQKPLNELIANYDDVKWLIDQTGVHNAIQK